jgi:hypothetical protein
MQLRLHANATTTPRTRAYIQKSTASDAAPAREPGIHPRTVARGRGPAEPPPATRQFVSPANPTGGPGDSQ